MKREFYTYKLILDTLPKGVSEDDFRRIITRAAGYMKWATNGRVEFQEVLSVPARNEWHVNIGFDELRGGACGNYMNLNGVKSIGFDPTWKWSTRWWHVLFSKRQNLYAVAVHELGHLIGLKHVPQEWASVMSPHPAFGEFTDIELAELRRGRLYDP